MSLRALLSRYVSTSMLLSSVTFAALLSVTACNSVPTTQVDVLIIGGGASGVSAAVQASRMGATVFVAEESTWLGGMLTGAGVSAVDGNYRMPAGLFGEFRSRLEEHYGGLEALKTGWVSSVLFEPSVGDSIFKSMIAAEPNISVAYNAVPAGIKQHDGSWTATFEKPDGKKFAVEAKVLIDGTELGDVAKELGVKYDIGMESRELTGEDIAPEQSNGIIQDLTMVAVLKDYGHDVTIPEPEDYDPDEFACTAINDLCVNPKQPNRMWSVDKMITYGKLPNGKYMINWPIEGNDYFVNIIEMNREQRDSAIAEAKAHTMRYIYFMQKELGLNTLGLADDEFPTDDLLPFLPYHRESRRIHGKVRFDLNHIMSPYDTAEPLYRTAIAVGDYPVDHHHHAYDGVEDLPNLYFHPVPSYGLPLGVIMPDSVENLLVTEKSISVSNIANGTTRLQPVVVQIGQAAGAVAALAARDNVDVSKVSVRDVQSAILDAGGYLLPYLDVDKNDPAFKPYQRIGATGLLRGEGRSISWSNETWLRVAEPLKAGELADFIQFYDVDYTVDDAEADVTLSQAEELIKAVDADINLVGYLADLGIDKQPADMLTRGEFALLVDVALNPFAREVTIHGRFADFE